MQSALYITCTTWSVLTKLLPSIKLVKDVWVIIVRENSTLNSFNCRGKKGDKIFVYGRAMPSSYLSTSCQAPDSCVMQTSSFYILCFAAKCQSPSRCYRLFKSCLIALFPMSTSEVVFPRFSCCPSLESLQQNE